MTFEEFMPSIHAKWRAVWDFDKTDMRKAFEAGHKSGMERACEIAEENYGKFASDLAARAFIQLIRKEASNERRRRKQYP